MRVWREDPSGGDQDVSISEALPELLLRREYRAIPFVRLCWYIRKVSMTHTNMPDDGGTNDISFCGRTLLVFSMPPSLSRGYAQHSDTWSPSLGGAGSSSNSCAR